MLPLTDFSVASLSELGFVNNLSIHLAKQPPPNFCDMFVRLGLDPRNNRQPIVPLLISFLVPFFRFVTAFVPFFIRACKPTWPSDKTNSVKNQAMLRLIRISFLISMLSW